MLQEQFIKKKNQVYARHILYTRKQKSEESIEVYLTSLKQLSKECNFRAVTAQAHQEEAVRDSFINGLKSSSIRQRILEEMGTVTLQQVWEKARSMETAQKNAESYNLPIYTATVMPANNIHFNPQNHEREQKQEYNIDQSPSNLTAAARQQQPITQCWNCGRARHQSRQQCPAKDAICYKCQKRGHFAKSCRSGVPFKKPTNASTVCSENPDYPVLATTSSTFRDRRFLTGRFKPRF